MSLEAVKHVTEVFFWSFLIMFILGIITTVSKYSIPNIIATSVFGLLFAGVSVYDSYLEKKLDEVDNYE